MDRAAGTALLACALAVALALSLALPGVAGAATGPSLAPQTDDVDPDGVVLRAHVAPDGSATWTVEYRIRLDNPNVTEAFEGLQADIRANRSAYVGRFAARMNRTVAAASNATGREMRLANVSVTAEKRQLPQSYGVVSYRFEWIGFAQVDGDRLLVGDALSGLFLDSESRLIISWPDDYEAVSVSPDGYDEREGAVVWEGPVDFGPDQPRIVLRPAGGLPVGALAMGVLALLGLAAAALVYRRRGERDEGAAPAATAGSEPGEGGAGAGEAGSAGAAAAETGEETPAEPPEELLSPEEQVLKLVRERGGRVKQQAVVEEFDWTAARTSQVVGSLRDDGRIETFRLGRENVLTLPDTGVVVDEEGEESDGRDGSEDDDAAGSGDDGDEGVDWRP
ncbi:MAG: helix-turn-helix transcriptional regulator [Haloferacaceae archaeon]